MREGTEVQVALLRQSVDCLTERVESLLEKIEAMETRISKQEHWHSRLTGAWVVLSLVAGFLFGKGGF